MHVNITSIILSVIYHTTSNREPENVILRQHNKRNLDNILAKQPNALVLITGDFNPTSTGLKSKDLTQANHLKQLVTFKQGILRSWIGFCQIGPSYSNCTSYRKLHFPIIIRYWRSQF